MSGYLLTQEIFQNPCFFHVVNDLLGGSGRDMYPQLKYNGFLITGGQMRLFTTVSPSNI